MSNVQSQLPLPSSPKLSQCQRFCLRFGAPNPTDLAGAVATIHQWPAALSFTPGIAVWWTEIDAPLIKGVGGNVGVAWVL